MDSGPVSNLKAPIGLAGKQLANPSWLTGGHVVGASVLELLGVGKAVSFKEGSTSSRCCHVTSPLSIDNLSLTGFSPLFDRQPTIPTASSYFRFSPYPISHTSSFVTTAGTALLFLKMRLAVYGAVCFPSSPSGLFELPSGSNPTTDAADTNTWQASTAVATGVVLSAFNQRANFYSACVYLAQSNACLMVCPFPLPAAKLNPLVALANACPSKKKRKNEKRGEKKKGPDEHPRYPLGCLRPCPATVVLRPVACHGG